MNTQISKDKVTQEQNPIVMMLASNKEYIWKNISKIESIKKEDSFKKSQELYRNLQLKLK